MTSAPLHARRVPVSRAALSPSCALQATQVWRAGCALGSSNGGCGSDAGVTLWELSQDCTFGSAAADATESHRIIETHITETACACTILAQHAANRAPERACSCNRWAQQLAIMQGDGAMRGYKQRFAGGSVLYSES